MGRIARANGHVGWGERRIRRATGGPGGIDAARAAARSAARAAARALVLVVAVTALGGIVGCSPGGPTPNCGSSPPMFDRTAAPDPDCPPDDDPQPPPPFPDCDGCGQGSGDPHVTTFDQQRYDLHAAAELVAARSSVDDFEVQWRQEPSSRGRRGGGVASISAVAVRLAGDRFTLTAGHDDPLRVDGETVALEPDGSVVRPSGVAVLRQGDHHWAVVGPEGVPSVVVAVRARFVDVEVALAPEHEGAVSGILGDADGDPADDLVLADGTTLPVRPPPEELYPAFAESWLVDDETTLFDYEDGLGPDDYWDPTFPGTPLTLEDLSPAQRAEAEAVCREAGVTEPAILDECVLDVAATGDEAYAEAAAARQARLADRPRTSSTGEAAWDVILDGATLAGPDLQHDGEGHLLVPVRGEEGGYLVALDADEGTVAWDRRAVVSDCAPAVTDDAVVAMTEAAGGQATGLVALDPSDGSDLVRYLPEGPERLGSTCLGGLAAADDTVVGTFGTRVRGFAVDGLRPRWSMDLPEAALLAPIPTADGGAVWVVHRGAENTSVVVLLVEAASGEVLAEGELDDARIESAHAGVADGEALITGAIRPSDRSQPRLVRFEARGDDVEVAWSRDLVDEGGPEGIDRPPPRLALAGSSVVGYTAGAFVSAFDREDGERRWTSKATSFYNNGGLVLGDDAGRTFISSFGGAWLEVFDADGEKVLEVPAEELFGPDGARNAGAFGPVVDGVLFVGSGTADGASTVVAAVEVGDG